MSADRFQSATAIRAASCRMTAVQCRGHGQVSRQSAAPCPLLQVFRDELKHLDLGRVQGVQPLEVQWCLGITFEGDDNRAARQWQRHGSNSGKHHWAKGCKRLRHVFDRPVDNPALAVTAVKSRPENRVIYQTQVVNFVYQNCCLQTLLPMSVYRKNVAAVILSDFIMNFR